MSNKISTVDKYFEEEFKIAQEVMPAIWYDLKLKAISFAKLHVEAALKAASEAAKDNIISYSDWEKKPNIILSAYPLTNIK